jgi:hypothetical protein
MTKKPTPPLDTTPVMPKHLIAQPIPVIDAKLSEEQEQQLLQEYSELTGIPVENLLVHGTVVVER